jgi:signal peptidase I
VFRYPIDIKQTFVKRAIGVPGDHLKLVNKQLFLNGHAVNEPYKVNKSGYIDSYRDNFPSEPNSMVYAPALQMLQNNQVNGEIVVPPNSVFAMGDNRDFSLDSRYWGFVPRENIIGKPLVIYWSYDAPPEQLASSSIGVAHLEDLALHFFSKTRWSRTLKFPHSYPLQ